MKTQRHITIVAIGAVLAISAGTAEARPAHVHMGWSVGHYIAWPIAPMPVVVRPVIVPPPPVRPVVITSPLRCRFVPIGYWYKPVMVSPPVVVAPPVVETIVVKPAPVVITKVVTVESVVVTVWIRNSNGSQSPVQLTRSGPGYIGPRGEYYPAMPGNEQLRTVYGF